MSYRSSSSSSRALSTRDSSSMQMSSYGSSGRGDYVIKHDNRGNRYETNTVTTSRVVDRSGRVIAEDSCSHFETGPDRVGPALALDYGGCTCPSDYSDDDDDFSGSLSRLSLGGPRASVKRIEELKHTDSHRSSSGHSSRPTDSHHSSSGHSSRPTDSHRSSSGHSSRPTDSHRSSSSHHHSSSSSSRPTDSHRSSSSRATSSPHAHPSDHDSKSRSSSSSRHTSTPGELVLYGESRSSSRSHGHSSSSSRSGDKHKSSKRHTSSLRAIEE